jgi:hypothetical protein
MEEGSMKKNCLFFVIISFLVLSLAGISYGWQGRMAGMGDPYGLVHDESDFLFHPAKIANEKGINFFGNYRFNYTDVGDWNITLTYSNPGNFNQYPFKNSGDEFKHEGLLGAVIPLGPGKMGILLEYSGRRGEYDGVENQFGTGGSNDYTFSLKNPLDAYSLRVLYGLPIMGMDVGFDLGLDYKNEKNKSSFLAANLSPYTENYIWGLSVPERALRLFMIPYDSNYWEFLWKLGIGKKFDSFDINATLRGSYIISADNKYQYIYQAPLGGGGFDYNASMDGDVKGYRIGFDVWARAKLGEGLTLPFILSIESGTKKRDGEGIGTGNTDSGLSYEYQHKEKELSFKLGGGLEKKLAGNTLVAGGLYYNYVKNSDSIWFTRGSSEMAADSGFPSRKEHQFMLRLLGEKNLSPLLALRMGLNIFYSFVKESYNHYDSGSTTDFSLDGSRWGIGASMGGTVKFQRFSVEPFLSGGYQRLSLNGDGSVLVPFVLNLIDASKIRREWSIGGGFSIKFN